MTHRNAIAGLVCGLVAYGVALLPAATAEDNPAQAASSAQLRRIGLAIQQYHEAHKWFPLAGSLDKELGIGLSWRVRILPFLGHESLYEKFDFNSPWDSTNNRALVSQMPEVYKAPFVKLEEGTTIYLGVVGSVPGEGKNWQERATFFHYGPRPRRIHDMIDGTAYTIMIVEADPAEAVLWTKPDDWEFDPRAPRRGLGGVQPQGFLALFADGSVGLVPHSVSEETLRRLFHIRDKRPVEGYTPPSREKEPADR